MNTAAVTDPERQFLGCLMHLSATAARRLLAGMRPDDVAGPKAAYVFGLAIRLVAADHTPTPVALLDRAMETTDTTPRTGGANRLQELGVWIADTYREALTLPAEPYGASLKGVLLKAAWRRAVREHAVRLLQGVEEWSTPSLWACLDDTSYIQELWDRYLAADTGRGMASRLEVAA